MPQSPRALLTAAPLSTGNSKSLLRFSPVVSSISDSTPLYRLPSPLPPSSSTPEDDTLLPPSGGSGGAGAPVDDATSWQQAGAGVAGSMDVYSNDEDRMRGKLEEFFNSCDGMLAKYLLLGNGVGSPYASGVGGWRSYSGVGLQMPQQQQQGIPIRRQSLMSNDSDAEYVGYDQHRCSTGTTTSVRSQVTPTTTTSGAAPGGGFVFDAPQPPAGVARGSYMAAGGVSPSGRQLRGGSLGMQFSTAGGGGASSSSTVGSIASFGLAPMFRMEPPSSASPQQSPTDTDTAAASVSRSTADIVSTASAASRSASMQSPTPAVHSVPAIGVSAASVSHHPVAPTMDAVTEPVVERGTTLFVSPGVSVAAPVLNIPKTPRSQRPSDASITPRVPAGGLSFPSSLNVDSSPAYRDVVFLAERIESLRYALSEYFGRTGGFTPIAARQDSLRGRLNSLGGGGQPAQIGVGDSGGRSSSAAAYDDLLQMISASRGFHPPHSCPPDTNNQTLAGAVAQVPRSVASRSELKQASATGRADVAGSTRNPAHQPPAVASPIVPHPPPLPLPKNIKDAPVAPRSVVQSSGSSSLASTMDNLVTSTTYEPETAGDGAQSSASLFSNATDDARPAMHNDDLSFRGTEEDRDVDEKTAALRCTQNAQPPSETRDGACASTMKHGVTNGASASANNCTGEAISHADVHPAAATSAVQHTISSVVVMVDHPELVGIGVLPVRFVFSSGEAKTPHEPQLRPHPPPQKVQITAETQAPRCPVAPSTETCAETKKILGAALPTTAVTSDVSALHAAMGSAGSLSLTAPASSVFQLTPIIQNNYIVLGRLPGGNDQQPQPPQQQESLADGSTDVLTADTDSALLAFCLRRQQKVVVKRVAPSRWSRLMTLHGSGREVAASGAGGGLVGVRRLHMARRASALDTLQRLTELRHPNLVSVVDIIVDGDREVPPMSAATAVYVVQEFCDGAPLSSYLAAAAASGGAGGVVSIAAVVHIAVSVLTALDYLHRNGVAHGCVTNETVWITLSGAVLLSDVGGWASTGCDVAAHKTTSLVGEEGERREDVRVAAAAASHSDVFAAAAPAERHHSHHRSAEAVQQMIREDILATGRLLQQLLEHCKHLDVVDGRCGTHHSVAGGPLDSGSPKDISVSLQRVPQTSEKTTTLAAAESQTAVELLPQAQKPQAPPSFAVTSPGGHVSQGSSVLTEVPATSGDVLLSTFLKKLAKTMLDDNSAASVASHSHAGHDRHHTTTLALEYLEQLRAAVE